MPLTIVQFSLLNIPLMYLYNSECLILSLTYYSVPADHIISSNLSLQNCKN